MMTYITLTLVVGLFAAGLQTTGAPVRAGHMVIQTNDALKVLRTPHLTDDAKASAIRAAAHDMFIGLCSILLRTLAALVMPLAIITSFAAAGVITLAQFAEASADWRWIAVATALATSIALYRS